MLVPNRPLCFPTERRFAGSAAQHSSPDPLALSTSGFRVPNPCGRCNIMSKRQAKHWKKSSHMSPPSTFVRSCWSCACTDELPGAFCSGNQTPANSAHPKAQATKREQIQTNCAEVCHRGASPAGRRRQHCTKVRSEISGRALLRCQRRRRCRRSQRHSCCRFLIGLCQARQRVFRFYSTCWVFVKTQ